jgi:hypothetical protein
MLHGSIPPSTSRTRFYPENMTTNLHIQPNARWARFGSCFSQDSKRVLAMHPVTGRAKE